MLPAMGNIFAPFVLFPRKVSFRATRITKKQLLIQSEAIFSPEILIKPRNLDLVSFQTTKFVLFLERYEGLFEFIWIPSLIIWKNRLDQSDHQVQDLNKNHK